LPPHHSPNRNQHHHHAPNRNHSFQRHQSSHYTNSKRFKKSNLSVISLLLLF
jgi:hypothetical protein